MNNQERPFTTAVRLLRDKGARYNDLASKSFAARSTSWFNKLLNSRDPWVVNPPNPDTLVGLRILLDVPDQVLRRWIATEWYGIPGGEQPQRTDSLARSISHLDPEDRTMVEVLAMRLRRQKASPVHAITAA